MVIEPLRPPILPLTLDAVGVRLGGEALLADVSLEFAHGAPSIVLGPNGAGKTLLLKLCHGLMAPTSGFVHWADARTARRPDAQAMVFQRPVLLRRSVAANVRYAMRVAGVDRARSRQRLDEALERAGLAAIAGRPARVLSGGEQQRLALARAWALRPQVLFLDEPTSHLDPAATRAVERLIGFVRDAGTKIVMTTHDLGQARRLAGDIVFLHRGRVVETGPAEAFFDAPRSAEAQAFVQGRLLW